MARLKDMLEPGETVLHHSSSATKALRFLAGAGSFLILFLAVLFIDFDRHTGLEMLRVLGLASLVAAAMLSIVAIPLALLHLLPFGVCIVSDRRILLRRGLSRPVMSEIRLSEIEDAAYVESELRLSGGGRAMTLESRRHGISADLLAQILPRWFPDAGKAIARPGRVLQAGEAIIFHYPPRYLAWVGKVSALCLAALFLLVGYDDFVVRDWSGILSSLMLAGMFFWFFYPPRADRHGWYCLVTNRRLMQHFDWDRTRYEEIPLAGIDAEYRSQFADKLAATHNGRDLDIPAKGKDAERVLAAIEAAKGAE